MIVKGPTRRIWVPSVKLDFTKAAITIVYNKVLFLFKFPYIRIFFAFTSLFCDWIKKCQRVLALLSHGMISLFAYFSSSPR